MIRDPLFPIGRDEEPFSKYESKLTANLSRRHARIFQEAGHIYVADVGSRNGTRLNQKPVEQQPVKIHQGDILSFAGKLDYQVEIIEPQPSDVPSPEKKTGTPVLVLIPKRKKSRLEPMVVSSFPFLIGKKAPAFVEELATEQEAAHYLSRRHAHIFSQGEKLCIEDLGSANGTYVNGERLGETAHVLNDGDELAFGAADLTFKVKLQTTSKKAASSVDGDGARSESEDLEAEVSAAIPDEMREHTIFISSANSFLDIFCATDDEDEAVRQSEDVPEKDDTPESPGASGSAPPRSGSGLVRWGRNLRTFSGELRQALREPDKKSRRHRRWGVSGVLVVGLIAAAVYYQGSDTREIEQLLQAGQYRESALKAKAYLSRHPASEDVAAWSREATLKALLPPWMQSMDQGNYGEALAQLQAGRELVMQTGESAELLELLQGLTGLHQYVTERGGVNARLNIYRDEATIEQLWQWWQAEEANHRRHMQYLLTTAPEFAELHRLSFSYLRALESERSVYLSAIENLKMIIERKLDSDRAGELEAVLHTFAEQYPKVGGLDLLQRDLENYLKLQALLSEGEAEPSASATAALAQVSFSSEPFVRRYREMQQRMQPLQDVETRQQRVAAAWRNGELEAAIAQLASLVEETGRETLRQDLERKQEIWQAYDWLQSQPRVKKRESEYGERLQALYRQLDSERDTYLIAALEPAYRALGSSGLESADQAWRDADDRWARYQRDGGIRGAQRLEEKISPAFRRKARLLSDAWNQVALAKHSYDAMNRTLNSEQQALYQKIKSESELQRRSLQQLSMVLSAELLDAKLALLADPAVSNGRREAQ